MVFWMRLLLLFTLQGGPHTTAELVTATCFPTLAQHNTVATSNLSLVPPITNSPTHKVFCNGNQTGFWTYKTPPPNNNRACMDFGYTTSATVPPCNGAPSHVSLTWLPGAFGTGLSEYNISFEGMWTAFAPGLTSRAAYLSLGTCFVMNGGNGLDSKSSGPDWFGGNMSGFDAGSFHSFFIEVTTNYTKVNMDGKLVFQDGGVGMRNYLDNRNCQALGHYFTGAMFGGFISGNARILFSRVEGQVRNVKLEAEVPDAVAGTTGLPQQGTTQAGGSAQGSSHSQGVGTTTGSAPTSGATTISGNFKMSVSNAAAFINDLQAKTAVQQAIANVSGVTPSKVQASLSMARRLDIGVHRLLTSGTVQVDYVISLPAGSPSSGAGSASSVSSSLQSVTMASLTAAVTSALSGSSTSYTVTVTTQPTVTITPVSSPEVSNTSWDVLCRPLWIVVTLWHLVVQRAFPDCRES